MAILGRRSSAVQLLTKGVSVGSNDSATLTHHVRASSSTATSVRSRESTPSASKLVFFIGESSGSGRCPSTMSATNTALLRALETRVGVPQNCRFPVGPRVASEMETLNDRKQPEIGDVLQHPRPPGWLTPEFQGMQRAQLIAAGRYLLAPAPRA